MSRMFLLDHFLFTCQFNGLSKLTSSGYSRLQVPTKTIDTSIQNVELVDTSFVVLEIVFIAMFKMNLNKT